MRYLLFLIGAALFAQPYNGVPTGTITYSTGKFGNAATVNATNYITVPAGATNFPGNSWTITAWVQTPTLVTAIAIANGTGTGATAISMSTLGTSSGLIEAQVGAGYGFGPSVTVNTWQHFAIVCAGGTAVRAYLDGVQFLSQTATCGTPNLPLIFGWDGTNSWKPWTGLIDEVAIWTSALYSSNFTPPTAALVGNETNLRAYFPLNSNANDAASGGGSSLAPGSLTPVVGLLMTAPTGGTSPYSYQLQSYSGACASGTFANDGAALTGQTSSATFARADGTTKCYRVVITDAASATTNTNSLTAPATGGGMRSY